MDLQEAYRILGLSPDATTAEVKAAYRDLLWVWHPDRVVGRERVRTRAENEVRRINEAYSRIRSEPVSPVPDGPPVALDAGTGPEVVRILFVLAALAALSILAVNNLYGLTEQVRCWF